jgi:hypothetical protein
VEDRQQEASLPYMLKRDPLFEKVRHNIEDMICLVTTTSEQRAETLESMTRFE